MTDTLPTEASTTTAQAVIARCRGCGWVVGGFDPITFGDALADHFGAVADPWHLGIVAHFKVCMAVEDDDDRADTSGTLALLLGESFAFASADVPVPAVA